MCVLRRLISTIESIGYKVEIAEQRFKFIPSAEETKFESETCQI